MRRKMSGFRLIEIIAARNDHVVAGAGHEPERLRHVADDEGELADLREAARDGERGLQRMPADDDDDERGKRFHQEDDAEHAER